jgi:glycosyltransferase involved in cell wall biosynthesis
VKGLAEAILYLIRNEKIREELGKKARKFIQENYSIDMIAEKYITLYQRLLDGK